MRYQLIGVNHKSAPLEVRERLAIPESRLPDTCRDLTSYPGIEEGMVISTCNRVEIVTHTTNGHADLRGFLHDHFHLDPDELDPHLYEFREKDAVRHLFRVAASLDSMIVGEAQIAGQVKKAYEVARDHASAGPLLHALFQHARQVAKRVRAETGIARGQVSVSSAAVDYVRQVFDHFGDKTVLVIGAGKMGELTLRHLNGLNPHKILVTNRSPEKAQAVANGCGGEAVAWDRL